MATTLGAHNARIAAVRALLSKKGRREQRAFVIEGHTLLAEARRSATALQAVYATPQAFAEIEQATSLEASGVPIFIVDERTIRKISDAQTPPGIVAVAPIATTSVPALLETEGLVLVLADVGDPGNAGTLLRSAEAFGVHRVIFGSLGVEPFTPKVVRASMGAIFRMRIAFADPEDLAVTTGWDAIGLRADGAVIGELRWSARSLLVVGGERQGLGRWTAACTDFRAIPMRGPTESLNAAVAGSIALYEATRRTKP